MENIYKMWEREIQQKVNNGVHGGGGGDGGEDNKDTRSRGEGNTKGHTSKKRKGC